MPHLRPLPWHILIDMLTHICNFVSILTPALASFLYGIGGLVILYTATFTIFVLLFWQRWLIAREIDGTIEAPPCFACERSAILNLLYGPFRCCWFCLQRRLIANSHIALPGKFLLQHGINVIQFIVQFNDEEAVLNHSLAITSSVDEAQDLLHQSSLLGMVLGFTGLAITAVVIVFLV